MLVGCRYIQAEDPGQTGTGYEWLNTTTGRLCIRNLDDTKWIHVAWTNLKNSGYADASVSSSDFSNFYDLESPAFSELVNSSGIEIATVADLTTLRDGLLRTISDFSDAVNTQGQAQLKMTDNISISYGGYYPTTRDFTTKPIVFPIFKANNQRASVGECKWFPGALKMRFEHHFKDWDWYRHLWVNNSKSVIHDPTKEKNLMLIMSRSGEQINYSSDKTESLPWYYTCIAIRESV